MFNVLKKRIAATKATNKLHDYVDIVKSILYKNGLNIPFYIAGGAVYSTLKGLDDFGDIDVFFYNQEDCSKIELIKEEIHKKEHARLKNHLNATDDAMWIAVSSGSYFDTNNALTLYPASLKNNLGIIIDKDIQFIKKASGAIDDIFDGFDINCSKVCITSEYELIQKVQLDDNIEMDFSNFKSNTLQRYIKYLHSKRVDDPDNITLFQAFDYLVEHYYDDIDDSYHGSTMKGWHLISLYFNSNNDIIKLKYVHDLVCKKFHVYDRIKAFNDLNVLPISIMNDACDEYVIYLWRVGISNTYTKEQLNNAMMAYPELFI